MNIVTREVPILVIGGGIGGIAAALALAKKSIYAWDAIHFDKGLARAERIYLEELIATEDAREGIAAFLEKRSPKWTGR